MARAPHTKLVSKWTQIHPMADSVERRRLTQRLVHAARHANEWREPYPEGERIQLTGRAGLFLPSLFHGPEVNELRERAAAVILPHLLQQHRYVTMLLAQPSILLPTNVFKRNTAGRPHRESERTPLPTRDPHSPYIGYTGFINLSSTEYRIWVAPESATWEARGGGQVEAEEEEDEDADDDATWGSDPRWLEHRVRIPVQPGEILLLDQRTVRSYPSEIQSRDRILLHIAFLAGDVPPPPHVLEHTRHLVEQGDIPARLPNGATRNIFAAVTRDEAQRYVVQYATRLKRRCTHRADWRIGPIITSHRVPLASLPSLRARNLPAPIYTASQLTLLGL